VMIPLIFIGSYLSNWPGNVGMTVELLILAISIVYKPYMEKVYGATLGKMALRIKVVSENFESIDSAQAIKRYVPWIIGHLVTVAEYVLVLLHYSANKGNDWTPALDSLPYELPVALQYIGTIVTIISVITISNNIERQGLHDNFAKTYCISTKY